MPACPKCNAMIPEGTLTCPNCNAALSSNSTALPMSSNEKDMRLEKALKRSEQLSYAAAGLGIAILALLIIISIV